MEKILSKIFIGTLFIPLFACNVSSPLLGEEYDFLLNGLRAISQILFFLSCVALVFFKKLYNDEFLELRSCLFVCLLFTLSLVSLYLNGCSPFLYYKSIVFFVYCLSFFIVLKIIIVNIDIDDFVTDLSRNFVYFVIFLSICLLVVDMAGLNPYYRVGYPLIPGVFSFYCTVAFVIVLFFRFNILLAAFLAVIIMMTGSRSGIGLSVLVALFTLFSGKFSIKRATVFLLVALLPVLIFQDIGDLLYRVLLAHRVDFSSGRFGMWSQAFELIVEKPFFGWGIRPTFEDASGLGVVRSHNSFIELSANFGLVYSVVAYVVWAVFFYPGDVFRKSYCRISSKVDLLMFGKVLFLLVTLKSLVTTTFWTNMSDPAMHYIMLILFSITSSKFIVNKENSFNEGQSIPQSLSLEGG